jgi:hypothetical protein
MLFLRDRHLGHRPVYWADEYAIPDLYLSNVHANRIDGSGKLVARGKRARRLVLVQVLDDE